VTALNTDCQVITAHSVNECFFRWTVLTLRGFNARSGTNVRLVALETFLTGNSLRKRCLLIDITNKIPAYLDQERVAIFVRFSSNYIGRPLGQRLVTATCFTALGLQEVGLRFTESDRKRNKTIPT
jgi:hypothetical protein